VGSGAGLGGGVEKKHIHERVPRRIWERFEGASSKGSHDKANIKGRYGVCLDDAFG